MTSLVSRSSLSITWVPPDLAEEEWEFFHHPAKQEFFQRHGIDWPGLQAAFAEGRLVPYPRGEILAGVPVRLAYAGYDDYSRYLAKAKRGYRLNYNRLEEALQRAGTLVVKAPIVLGCEGEALLFAGYRRLCLAWNYGMAPGVWLVPLAGGGDQHGD
ncbi:MAG TPA: hypothetical protein VIU41_14540 [Geobacteraceae bacterium]